MSAFTQAAFSINSGWPKLKTLPKVCQRCDAADFTELAQERFELRMRVIFRAR
jgi:hypothetical protein